MNIKKKHSPTSKIIYTAIALLTVLSCVLLVGIIDNNRKIHAIENTSEENSKAEEKTDEAGSSPNTSENSSETETKTPVANESTTKAESTSQGGGEQTVSGKTVYLTFDDGPSHVTDRVLDILDQYNIKASFFVVYSKNYEDRLREIHKRGHAIGLHTYSHKYNEIYASTDAFFNDLQKISDHVENIVGIKPKITRFPGGSSNEVSKKISPGIMTKLAPMVKDKGYIYFDWNCENGDGNGSNIAPEKLLAQTIATTPAGAKNVCVLMHDASDKDTTADALPDIIEHFKNKGYEFKVLSEDSYPVRHTIKN